MIFFHFLCTRTVSVILWQVITTEDHDSNGFSLCHFSISSAIWKRGCWGKAEYKNRTFIFKLYPFTDRQTKQTGYPQTQPLEDALTERRNTGALRLPSHTTCMDMLQQSDLAIMMLSSVRTQHTQVVRAPEEEGKAYATLHILTKQHMNMRNDQTQTHRAQPHCKLLNLPSPSTPTTDTTSMLHRSKTAAYLCPFKKKILSSHTDSSAHSLSSICN